VKDFMIHTLLGYFIMRAEGGKKFFIPLILGKTKTKMSLRN